ncbi:polysaccharide deacetylase family protein [Desulfosporosinus sp. FKA]|uniref:polysaccharide deacetylase family protein n=1 Tax=Desulfosporosinus sp. FKA TaxID=1969834 RepID=UPI000B49F75D|nr:polysaccharide deacetylase family protein [Desulfosporosinus sp. FKA]
MSLQRLVVDFMFFVIVTYIIIPNLVLRFIGIGTFKRQKSEGVALTFDDGPDPDYTPRILDVLERYNVPATFFVVGENAASYPDLIKEIQGHGHQLGIHCQQHLCPWFLNPWATWRKWDEGVATLERLTGQNVEWIRPPWGLFNLALWLWLKWRKKKVVLWNVEGLDWFTQRRPEQITDRVLKKMSVGSIVLLHDSGGQPRAPENTVCALESICRKLTVERRLPVVSLDLSK